MEDLGTLSKRIKNYEDLDVEMKQKALEEIYRFQVSSSHSSSVVDNQKVCDTE